MISLSIKKTQQNTKCKPFNIQRRIKNNVRSLTVLNTTIMSKIGKLDKHITCFYGRDYDFFD